MHARRGYPHHQGLPKRRRELFVRSPLVIRDAREDAGENTHLQKHIASYHFLCHDFSYKTVCDQNRESQKIPNVFIHIFESRAIVDAHARHGRMGSRRRRPHYIQKAHRFGHHTRRLQQEKASSYAPQEAAKRHIYSSPFCAIFSHLIPYLFSHLIPYLTQTPHPTQSPTRTRSRRLQALSW